MDFGQIWEIAQANLLSPMVLFFLLGVLAVLVKSDLKVPDATYVGYTMIILFSIGIKGGKELKHFSFHEVYPTAIAAVALSLSMMGIAYIVLNKLFKHSVKNSLAVAAHYGSVSAVTYIACIAFLEKMKVPYESFMTAVLALKEGPAIIAAILLYKMYEAKQEGNSEGYDLKPVLREAFFGKSIFLLLSGIMIGLVADTDGLKKIEPLFIDLFYGVLCIFLLHMGMIATKSLKELENVSMKSFLFAIVLPLIGGTLGVFVGSVLGLSVGGAIILGTLSGSASYIAAPAAVQHAIPKANSGLYLGSALGITLPFNLIIGIPLYYSLAKVLVT